VDRLVGIFRRASVLQVKGRAEASVRITSHIKKVQDRMKVSAALIVKNEEKTLGRCLKRIKDDVDEIIVVDTGSQDKTKEVAGQYTDCIYDFPWRKDFAAARQFSFDHATGDWVLWLDADDVVLNANKIRQSLRDVSSDIKGFYWKYIAGQDENGNSICEFWRERCIRNDGTFHWVGKVHEVLIPHEPCAMARNEEIFVVHRPHPSGLNGNPYRNIEILTEEYARTQHHAEPRLLLYMGNEYADLGELDRALNLYHRYVQVSTWDDEKYLAQVKIAALYRRQGKYEHAVDAELQALKTCPQWPHAYFGLAQTYYFLQAWPKVIHWAEVGRRLPTPDTICIVNPMDVTYNWIIYYTNALYHMGRVQEALEWTHKALEMCPGDTWHLANRRFFSGFSVLSQSPLARQMSDPSPGSSCPNPLAGSRSPASPTVRLMPRS
jgi:glycosyltransferase involved in cell wall biosynthesis